MVVFYIHKANFFNESICFLPFTFSYTYEINEQVYLEKIKKNILSSLKGKKLKIALKKFEKLKKQQIRSPYIRWNLESLENILKILLTIQYITTWK